MKYSIVIPTYNHCEDLLKPCITSILENTIMNDDIEIIIVANGCTDNTREYTDLLKASRVACPPSEKNNFSRSDVYNHPFKILWFDESIGYTRATNEGIKAADPSSEYIILLNNDIVLLKQTKNHWIDMLEHPFIMGGANVGITGPMKGHNSDTNRHFLIFFCVMIRHSVLREQGLLDEIFSPGSGEDVDFCIRLENAGYRVVETGDTDFTGDSVIGTGSFPIYHEGEKTVHDTNLVKDWEGIFNRNMDILAARYGKPSAVKMDVVSSEELPDGWFSDEDIKIYRTLLSSLPYNGKIIELGVWKGRSLCSVADIIKEKNLQVWAIDTFEGTDSTPYEKTQLADEAKRINIQAAFQKNIKDFGLDNNITVIKGSTFDAHALFDDKTFDLLFLDADHSFEAVIKDIKNWFPKIKPHGVFSGHDIAWNSVERAVCEYFDTKFNYVVGANIWWVYKPKIYDCFPFFNEFDLLDIRLHELSDTVDEFVLVESTKTFSGKNKPLYFNDNKERFAKFLPKITHIIQTDADEGTDYQANWLREEGQRDKIMETLIVKCKPNDIIISSDLDEIPRATAVKEYVLKHAKNGIMIMNQKYSYYYLNNFTTDCKWQEGRIFPFWEAEKYTLSKLRRGPTHHSLIPSLENAGWHFSFLGNAEHIRHKIESFAHTEFDKDEIKSDDNIKRALETGADLFPRGNTKFNPVNVDGSFPAYVLDNFNKYTELGYFRTPEVTTTHTADDLKPIKLNLGCGNLVYPDYINIDLYAPEADVKMDIRKLEYPDNYADEITAYHVFEHLSPYEAKDILSEWMRVLKPNGKLIMELPDIEAMCAAFGSSNKDERYRLLNCIYGATQMEHPHLFGWYAEILQDHLELVGFIQINFDKPQLIHHWGINFRVEALKPDSIIKLTPSKVTPKVLDTFLFFNELDILELRLNELYDVVDYFILLESNKTFVGKPKPYYFEENKDRFAKFGSKIINIKLNIPDELNLSPWDMEAYQRDELFSAVQSLVEKGAASDNDIIILSDVDEIPKPSAIINYDASNGMSTMNQNLYYYYVNCLSDLPWHGSRIAAWSDIKDISATQLRKNNSLPVINDGGWHFSFTGSIDNMVAKIGAYSHQEFNNDYFTNPEKIRQKIDSCQDIFERPINFKIIDIDNTLPKYIVDNEEYYKGTGLISDANKTL